MRNSVSVHSASNESLVAEPSPGSRMEGLCPWFNDYAARRIAAPEHQLPAGKNFVTWFREHEPAMRQNATLWDWNTIVATQLLPIFEAEPSAWEAVTFLNHRPRNATESLTAHLAEWHSRCPAYLRPFVSKIAALFGIGP